MRKGKVGVSASLPLSSLFTPLVTTQVTIGGLGDGGCHGQLNGHLASSMCDCVKSSSPTDRGQGNLSTCGVVCSNLARSLHIKSTGILCGSVPIFETELDSWLGLILAAGDSNRKWISENGDTWLDPRECHETHVKITNHQLQENCINI